MMLELTNGKPEPWKMATCGDWLATMVQPMNDGELFQLAITAWYTVSLAMIVVFATEVLARAPLYIPPPALAVLEDIDAEIDGGSRPLTARGVLMHLVWHWTYHSGQVGLLRRQWGELRYQWTFAQNVGAPR